MRRPMRRAIRRAAYKQVLAYKGLTYGLWEQRASTVYLLQASR